ncbi:MAG TPA: hypothetical protein VNX61_05490, partial [Rhizomicrobium sp.]|nr:hypothetical protein [Rhizomicrobium sp.]
NIHLLLFAVRASGASHPASSMPQPVSAFSDGLPIGELRLPGGALSATHLVGLAFQPLDHGTRLFPLPQASLLVRSRSFPLWLIQAGPVPPLQSRGLINKNRGAGNNRDDEKRGRSHKRRLRYESSFSPELSSGGQEEWQTSPS